MIVICIEMMFKVMGLNEITKGVSRDREEYRTQKSPGGLHHSECSTKEEGSGLDVQEIFF